MRKKTVLERFKEIEDLEVADEQGKTVKDILPYFCENVETALIKVEKEHKALEIIKKNFEFCFFETDKYRVGIYSNDDDYSVVKIISQEEFKLLKEVLE